MSPAHINAVQAAELVRHGLQIADRAVVSDIELCATWVAHLPGGWYDTQPMLNEHEHSSPVIDMNAQALDYALMRGLIERHTGQAHLVRITRQP
jgi:hypothetical protein